MTVPPHPQPPQPEPVEGADWPAADQLAHLTLLSRLSENHVILDCQYHTEHGKKYLNYSNKESSSSYIRDGLKSSG